MMRFTPSLPSRSRPASAILAAVFAATIGASPAPSAQPSACPLQAADLHKALGVAFADGRRDPAGIGPACTYQSRDGRLTLWIGLAPAMGSIESMRFMIGPPKTRLQPVGGDADKAVVIGHAPDVPSFPHIAYLRGGQLVQVHLQGIDAPAPGGTARDQAVAAWTPKLLALPRVP